ncbi:carboxyphosphonoenolpyruvate phosphonomutase [Fusarium tjaetaba]|uniref:Carboxyphosphonoenolpyruvate phosphonomutase n=1 Tax=Fusarium tjaetaba TaxID=1567544 RepID=A0A8H5RCY6_9HYPO|nr:carboxyphosphonoenolpyruvate phosphonomutase [Fusarium tjaetaba]KAF5629646.1 carboxyphosphonoenolpyruvate phosphonomutase [Fusarium tjaetaba]
MVWAILSEKTRRTQNQFATIGSKRLAQTLKSVHIPSQPLIFANVWDLASLNMVLSLNSEASKPVKAIATASWAFAASLGVEDEELTLEQNLASIRNITATVASVGLPLSVDLQDGYGSCLREAVTQAIQAGAHGLGQGVEHSLCPSSEQIRRLQLAVKAAADEGLLDFFINARCDVFALKEGLNLHNEARLQEAIRRGKAYLDAGATTVFFWRGYGAGFTEADVQTLVGGLDGQVAIRLGQT